MFDNMSDEEMSDVLLVVFVAETNASHVESVAQKVSVFPALEPQRNNVYFVRFDKDHI